MYKETKDHRIKRRADAYAKGEIDLDTFILLEKIDLEEEEEAQLEKKKPKSLLELDEQRRAEAEPSDASDVTTVEEGLVDFDLGLVGSDTDDRKGDFRTVLKSITSEEFKALSLYEQQRLYDFDPEAVEKIVEGGKKSIIEILHEEPKKFSPQLTVEEFKTMSLKDLNDLYSSDPDLYNRLCEESLSGGSGDE